MNATWEVRLKRHQAPVFPDRCVRCGCDSPDATFGVAARRDTTLSTILAIPGRRMSIDVPACRACRGRMIWHKRLRVAAYVLSGAAGLALAYLLRDQYRGKYEDWIRLGIVLACVLPVSAWDFMFPRAMVLRVDASEMQCAFRNSEYAAEFVELNGARVLSSDD